MSGALTFAIGMFGGLTMSVVKLLEFRSVPRGQRTDFSDPLFWVDLAWRPVLGGGVCWLHWLGNQEIGAIATFQLGISAPLLVKAAYSLKSEEPPEKTD